jgi:hypothetical protein
VRRTIRPTIAGLVILVSSAFAAGCSNVKPCTVSPIEIEETREHVGFLDKDLATARDRAKQLRDELAAKQAEFASKKDKPGELGKKVEELKKGSGRDEEKKDGDEDKGAGEE